MKFSHVLPLAALSTAFVLPPEEVLSEIAIEDHHRGNGWYQDAVRTKDDVLASVKSQYEEVAETSKDAWKQITETSRNALDEAVEYGNEAVDAVKDKAHQAGVYWPFITLH